MGAKRQTKPQNADGAAAARRIKRRCADSGAAFSEFLPDILGFFLIVLFIWAGYVCFLETERYLSENVFGYLRYELPRKVESLIESL